MMRISILAAAVVLMVSTAGAFTFAVATDQRAYTGPGHDTSEYFRGVCEAMALLGPGVFLISPGDIDPPADSFWTIQQHIAAGYPWYPVVGNHELPGQGSEAYFGANMDWLRAFDYDANGSGASPDPVNPGPSGCPETTFSFDHENAHFIVLNQYCDVGGDDVTTGDIPDHLYDWLAADLAATDREYVFVFGHEPAFPQPDADNGRVRHQWDSLNQNPDNRDRFLELLRSEGVLAYVCGHTHNYSAANLDGLWQIDGGHARGAGDTGAPSTFLLIEVDSDQVTLEVHRDIHDGLYDHDDIVRTRTLTPRACWTRSYQQGLEAYTGSSDTYLDGEAGQEDVSHGLSDFLMMGGLPDRSTLLRWELEGLPPDAEITFASLELTITDGSQDAYGIYQAVRPWEEDEATWNQAAFGSPWEIPGARGATDRDTTLLGRLASDTTDRFVYSLNDDGVAAVQSWVDDPAGNHGLIVMDYDQGDSVQIHSRESTDAQPRLTIGFCTLTGVIGDRVWSDTDGDGLQDPGEPGLAGVTVHLLDHLGSRVDSAISGADGTFRFCWVDPWEYRLEFIAPTGFSFSPRDQGSDDELDSDADPADGRTSFFTLAASEVRSGRDAGLWPDPTGTGQCAPEVPLVAKGATWRFLDDGSDQGTGWVVPGFDDSGWSSGPAQLGYGDGDEATVVGYGPDPDDKFITTYFRLSFELLDATVYQNLALEILRDDGAVVHLNGIEVFRTNMAGGPVAFDTQADSIIGGADESVFHSGLLKPLTLVDGPNVLAVEVHQGLPTSLDISLDLSLTGSTCGGTPTVTPTWTPTATPTATPTPPPPIPATGSGGALILLALATWSLIRRRR